MLLEPRTFSIIDKAYCVYLCRRDLFIDDKIAPPTLHRRQTPQTRASLVSTLSWGVPRKRGCPSPYNV